MDSSVYANYIEKIIPTTYSNIYIVDILSDLIQEYRFTDGHFVCNATKPFTTFYSELEKMLHHDDLKGYIDNITANNLIGKDYVRYEYRQLDNKGEYSWFSNISKLIELDNKRVVLVLVENINNNIKESGDPTLDVPTLQAKQNLIFEAVSSAIISLNNIINISYANENPEVKSVTQYVDNVISELTNTFPELNKSLTANLITTTNQGKTKTIVIVDDDKMTCNLLQKTFEDTYKIVVANDGQEAINILSDNTDLNTLQKKDKIVGVFLDLNMPVVDGFGVLDYMSSKNLLSRIPVIVISGDYDQATKDRAYSYPIADVLEKPFNIQIVKHRIRTFIKLYKSNNSLNEIVLNQHQEIKNILRTLVKSYLYDNADDINKIASYTAVLARQLSNDYDEYNFDNDAINRLINATKYYHIGLYTLPHEMLKKEEFNDDEKKIIQSHPIIGLSIFDTVLYDNTDRIFNHYAKDIIEYHEEKFDGSGYPLGIAGDNIPIVAQIVAVAIDYNKLSKKYDEEKVIEELSQKSGTDFNPIIIESLKKNRDKFKEIRDKK